MTIEEEFDERLEKFLIGKPEWLVEYWRTLPDKELVDYAHKYTRDPVLRLEAYLHISYTVAQVQREIVEEIDGRGI